MHSASAALMPSWCQQLTDGGWVRSALLPALAMLCTACGLLHLPSGRHSGRAPRRAPCRASRRLCSLPVPLGGLLAACGAGGGDAACGGVARPQPHQPRSKRRRAAQPAGLRAMRGAVALEDGSRAVRAVGEPPHRPAAMQGCSARSGGRLWSLAAAGSALAALLHCVPSGEALVAAGCTLRSSSLCGGCLLRSACRAILRFCSLPPPFTTCSAHPPPPCRQWLACHPPACLLQPRCSTCCSKHGRRQATPL